MAASRFRAINESGLYALIMRSRKQSARRFRKWITADVLPSIRRTGSYGAAAAPLDLSDPATLHRLILDHTGRALAARERIADLEPQAEALTALAGGSVATVTRYAIADRNSAGAHEIGRKWTKSGKLFKDSSAVRWSIASFRISSRCVPTGLTDPHNGLRAASSLLRRIQCPTVGPP